MSSTRRIEMLGLLLALVGLMDVTAASASAAAEFRLEGVTFAAGGITSKAFLAEFPSGELLVGFAEGTGWNLAVYCQGGFATGNILKGGNITVHAEFEKCTLLKNSSCIFYPEEGEEGTAGVISASGNGTIVLHGAAPGNIFATFQSPNFAEVYFGGPKCTLPEDNLIYGGIVLSFSTGLTELVEQKVCVTNGKEALFKVEQLYFIAVEKTSIDSSECGFAHLETSDKWGME